MDQITCTKCEETFPATENFFRRDRRSKTGFQSQCKECAQAFVRKHYVPFTELELEIYGEVGVKCPLWSRKCGECNAVVDCWRLIGIAPGDDGMPLKLKAKPKKLVSTSDKTLRKSSINLIKDK